MTINLNDLMNPKGNNELSAQAIFYWRDLYKKYVAPDENSIDMWYEDQLYGKVDHNQIPIYPSESSLTQLQSNNTVFAINFVAQAWEDLRQHITASVREGRINRNSVYATFEPSKGWTSIHSSYHDWNTAMFQAFSGVFMNTARDQKIINLEGFIDVYIEFIDKMSYLFPQTRESLILSNSSSPLMSGLIIEISNTPHDRDDAKGKYLLDRGYDRVVAAAQKFGFMIDKNAPWRFIANLESEEMKKYMREYGYDDKKDAFDDAYFKSHEYEIDVFKHYIWGWYDQYVAAKPTVNKISYEKCTTSSKKSRYFSKKQKREVLTEAQAFERISDEFWTKLYIYVRAKETQKPWRQVKFDRVVEKTLNLIRLKNKETGMAYFFKEIEKNKKKYIFSRNDFTEEEIDGILRERNANKHRGNFKL
jgi:hypothetical protein